MFDRILPLLGALILYGEAMLVLPNIIQLFSCVKNEEKNDFLIVLVNKKLLQIHTELCSQISTYVKLKLFEFLAAYKSH